MPTYSLVLILYITVQSLSLLLLAYLMLIILTSKPYFTKWTLFQVCVSEFVYGLTGLPVLLYGDDLVAKAFPLCIYMQKISVYFIYPLEFFSSVLAFYLWYALVKRDLDIEKKCFWYVSGAIWIYTTIYNAVLLKTASKIPNWGVLVSELGCKTSILVDSYYGYIIPTSILTFFAVLLTAHSTIILWRRQVDFLNIQNRRTAIKLGEAVRLCTWCFTFVVLMITPLVPRAIQSYLPYNDYTKSIEIIGYFSGASVGLCLFLIFGTDRKAAFFLPCYYVPPEKSQRPQYSFSDERVEIDAGCLDDEISQLSKAYLKQNTFNVNNNNYYLTTHSDNSETNEEDSFGSVNKELVSENVDRK